MLDLNCFCVLRNCADLRSGAEAPEDGPLVRRGRHADRCVPFALPSLIRVHSGQLITLYSASFAGQHTHLQFNSLQAFWPGLQVLLGDLEHAVPTQEGDPFPACSRFHLCCIVLAVVVAGLPDHRVYAAFYGLWQKYGALPERYLLNSGCVLLVPCNCQQTLSSTTHCYFPVYLRSDIHSSERYYPLRCA